MAVLLSVALSLVLATTTSARHLPSTANLQQQTQFENYRISCHHQTSVGMWIDFDKVQNVDLYMVGLHSTADSYKPFAFWTTVETSVFVDDLLPSTTYFVRVAAHNASAPSIVWNWFNVSLPVATECSTLPRPSVQAPHSLVPLETEISLVSFSWQNCKSPAITNVLWRLWENRIPEEVTTKWSVHKPANNCATAIHGLAPASTYEVKVVHITATGNISSDPILLRTKSPNSIYTTMHRVSEYTNNIDFLENHDSSSPDALAAFLTCTAGDNDFFSSASPITNYCVEHVDPKIVGWADYVSCNGPEASPRNNPEDPMCICDVYADRLIANQPASLMNAVCDPTIWTNDTHNDPICYCERDGQRSKWVIPEASDAFVGKMSVYLPYFYYELPRDDYPNTTYIGEHFSTPKNASCGTSKRVGDGCTWQSQPRGTVVYTSQFEKHGWNATITPHWPLHTFGPNNTEQTWNNIQAYNDAWDDLKLWISPRCCGC